MSIPKRGKERFRFVAFQLHMVFPNEDDQRWLCFFLRYRWNKAWDQLEVGVWRHLFFTSHTSTERRELHCPTQRKKEHSQPLSNPLLLHKASSFFLTGSVSSFFQTCLPLQAPLPQLLHLISLQARPAASVSVQGLLTTDPKPHSSISFLRNIALMPSLFPVSCLSVSSELWGRIS